MRERLSARSLNFRSIGGTKRSTVFSLLFARARVNESEAPSKLTTARFGFVRLYSVSFDSPLDTAHYEKRAQQEKEAALQLSRLRRRPAKYQGIIRESERTNELEKEKERETWTGFLARPHTPHNTNITTKPLLYVLSSNVFSIVAKHEIFYSKNQADSEFRKCIGHSFSLSLFPFPQPPSSSLSLFLSLFNILFIRILSPFDIERNMTRKNK